jgi:hypothetical protein
MYLSFGSHFSISLFILNYLRQHKKLLLTILPQIRIACLNYDIVRPINSTSKTHLIAYIKLNYSKIKGLAYSYYAKPFINYSKLSLVLVYYLHFPILKF